MTSLLSVFIMSQDADAVDKEKKKGSTASVSIIENDSGDSLSSGLYVPDELTVKKKTTVTWTNDDPIARHTVTEGSEQETQEGAVPSFDSGPLSPDGGKFSHTFEKKGTFPYYCSIHPAITGEITVR